MGFLGKVLKKILPGTQKSGEHLDGIFFFVIFGVEERRESVENLGICNL